MITSTRLSSWLNAPATAMLAAEGLRRLDFAKASRLPEGFGNLDERGRCGERTSRNQNTARMTTASPWPTFRGCRICRTGRSQH